MSTILLTPDSITQDHNVLTSIYPRQLICDPGYKKIFTDPSKRYVLASQGKFHPHQFDHPDTWTHLASALAKLDTQSVSTKMITVVEKGEDTDYLTGIFEKDVATLLVTATSRYFLYCAEKEESLGFAPCHPVCGLGSGGPYAVGMCHGGYTVSQIWDHLPHLDPMSSSIFTTHQLSDLLEGYPS